MRSFFKKKIWNILGKFLAFLGITLAVIVITLVITIKTFCNDSSGAQELFVTIMLETGSFKWVVPLFLSKDKIKKIVKDQYYTYNLKNKDGNEPSYEVLVNNQKLFQIDLKKVKTMNRLGMLSIPVWQLENVYCYLDKGIYFYEIKTLSTNKVNINKQDITKNYSRNKVIQELENVNNYVSVPSYNYYEVNNLLSKPTISIEYNDKKLEYSMDHNLVTTNDNL